VPDINADFSVFHDASQNIANKILISELLKALPVSAGAVKIKQIATNSSTTATETTAAIPADGTIPQSTEGTQLITATITPTSATSKLMIEFHCPMVGRSTGNLGIFALFKDNIANALDVSTTTTDDPDRTQSVFLRHIIDNIGSTAATTFKIRYGSNEGVSLSVLKSQSGTVTFGGVPQLNLTITEFV
jgi:hypothetical protein